MFTDKNIVLIVSGGVAAYKSAIFARLLMKQGANVNRIVDRISQLDDREISRAGLDTAIAHENRWLPLGIFLFSSILLLLIAKRRKQDDK
ncbi:hypothetical protein H7R52_11995 [Weissella confusa]|uniref:Flavoprotein domain-containing protein n=1 Tax=Weissella confusa TaxID=1583 RepID=A0A923SNU5_WEICO|nr:hypothetical protein [Weissella confusa]